MDKDIKPKRKIVKCTTVSFCTCSRSHYNNSHLCTPYYHYYHCYVSILVSDYICVYIRTDETAGINACISIIQSCSLSRLADVSSPLENCFTIFDQSCRASRFSLIPPYTRTLNPVRVRIHIHKYIPRIYVVVDGCVYMYVGNTQSKFVSRFYNTPTPFITEEERKELPAASLVGSDGGGGGSGPQELVSQSGSSCSDFSEARGALEDRRDRLR